MSNPYKGEPPEPSDAGKVLTSEGYVDAPDTDLKIKEIEVTKLNLQPGDVLAVKIYSDQVDEYSMDILRGRLTKLFPDNKIMLFSLPSGDKIDIDVIKTQGE